MRMGKERKSKGKSSGRMLPMLHPDAAGIDVGAEEVFVEHYRSVLSNRLHN
ncbi:MAG TPA: hypothetical protein VEQ63_10120 [Bryobacteraceae bacterium]|nr:hypothetical protein [Bryobacteraceae bacterium]